MKRRAVSGEGYPESATPPLTEAEAVEMDRRRVTVPLCDPSRTMGPANFHAPAAPPSTRVSGMLREEVRVWFGHTSEED